MISKPTRVLALMVVVRIGAIAGVAGNADRPADHPGAIHTPHASLGVRIEGRSELHFGNSSHRAARSNAQW